MSEEKPSFFLIIKEPPFPASYDENTYMERVLEEMQPWYSYNKYKSRIRLLIKGLPDSPNKLNKLIIQEFPKADLDKTMIQPFDDTHGGKGMRVTIFKLNAIESEAETMDEATKILEARIPKGYRIKSKRVISKPKQTKVIGKGQTEEEALTKAQSQVPENILKKTIKTIQQPSYENITITAFDEGEAKTKVKENIKTEDGKIIKNIELVSLGKSGFWNIMRKPNTYECSIFQQAVVQITYSEAKAKMVGILVKSRKKKVPNEELNKKFIETSDLGESNRNIKKVDIRFKRVHTKSSSKALKVLFDEALPCLPTVTTDEICRICSNHIKYDIDSGNRHVAGSEDYIKSIIKPNLETVSQLLYPGQKVIGFQVNIIEELKFSLLSIVVGDEQGSPGYMFGARLWRTLDQVFVLGWEDFQF